MRNIKTTLTALKMMLFTLWAQPKRKMFHRSSGQRGSAVVEAVLTVPIFFCAICTLLAIGQMLFAQTQIGYCLSQTADQLVQIEEIKDKDSPLNLAYAYSRFHELMQDSHLCNICVKGGTKGIVLLQDTKEGVVDLTAVYYLKVPVPYFNQLGFLSEKTISRRLFSGYMEHEGEGAASDPVVYVAEYGSVYHTSMTCSKICIKVADPMVMSNLLESRKYGRCDKCMKSGVQYAQFYITVSGGVCHSRLSCSGLKRTIKAMKLSEVKGMRICQNCGKH